MKKSEMLSKIKDHLSYYDLDLDDEELSDEAYCILSIIEKAGMLPPTVIFGATGEAASAKAVIDYTEMDFTFDWEPENETS